MRSLCGVVLMLAALTAPAPAQLLWCENADDVHALVEGTSVLISHDAALYNCCPDAFHYLAWVQEDAIVIQEIEVLNSPCDCHCCYDLQVSLHDVPPGDHVIEFTWFNYEEEDWVERSLVISVPDQGQPGRLVPGAALSSGCIQSQSVPELPPSEGADPGNETWGRIKALFE